jgi:hypothetical protein
MQNGWPREWNWNHNFSETVKSEVKLFEPNGISTELEVL